uniref:Pre-mRNA 3'-end-processing factor FIP1 n=1 Tax=Chrysemys picta bellii TaxID=8478 RepID=A0A8C3PE50_CHRPI
MSTGEVERLAADLSGTGGDEEEEWLYGDENEPERPEEQKASAPPPSANEEEAAENGVVKTKVTEAEDDSDSDSDDDEDDVHVTIGDIKTGAPQYGYGTAPVNLNIKTGGRVYGSSGAKVKGVDLDAPGSINGVPLLEVDLDSFEDKPWRKPGADLSDYFNYGFNEDTWKAYCEKQKRIRMGLEILPVTSTTNKIMSPFRTLQVLLLRGLVLWTPANSGIIMHEERKIENERERETERGIVIVIVIGNENVPERETGNVITAQLQVFSTVMKNDIGIENMQKEAMSVTEQAERKRNDTEKGDIEKKKRLDTNHLEVTAGVVMTVKKGTATGGINTKNPKEAKKEKKLVVNLPLNRKTLKLLQWNRHV